jgi:HAE1 family hydrophobic/amphiphilic exporter-1
MLMIYLSLALAGILSLMQLPVELYPNISFGEISIIINVRGGIPPTEVETLVTKVVEESVGTVSHLAEMLSISKEGESTVVLSFEPGINMEFAALEVREKFARVKNKLPKEIEKPVIAQFRRSDVPIIIVAITSLRRTTEEIRKIVDEQMRESMKRVNGIADVEVAGGRERKILIEVDQRKLAAYSLPLERVISMIGANNLNLLSGGIDVDKEKYLIRAIGLYKTVDDIKNIAVSTNPDGSIVRLKDIAKVLDSYLEPTGYARVNVRPVVSLYLQKESTANTIKVADGVVKELEKVRAMLPKDLQVVITSNQADFIKRSINNLKDSLLEGAGLIMLVLTYFLTRLTRKAMIFTTTLLLSIIFLPSFLLIPILLTMTAATLVIPKLRPILVVTSAIPISIIITFIFMLAMKLTINFMTLFGLALGVGMLVDNSIVVFENILKRHEEGMTGIPAAIEGTTEVWVAILAATLTHITVFLPMIFVGEEIKLLYGGVAWTVTISLSVSLFVAITVVPLLASRMKFSLEDMPKGYGKTNVVGVMRTIYSLQRKGITYCLRNRYRIILYAFLTFFIALFLFTRLGMEFLGTTEQSKFTVFIEMPTGTKLDVTDKIVKKVEALVKELPEVKSFSARVDPWSSKVYVELLGLAQRKRAVSEIIDTLRPKVERMRPAFIYFEEEQEVGTKEIILELFGYDYATMREVAVGMASRLGSVPGFTDTKIRMREGRPELGLKVSRDKASLFDMSVSDVANSVHAQMRGLRATLFHTESSEVETIARLDEQYRKTFKDLHKLILMNPEEDRIFLEQLTEFKYGLGPSEVWRKNKTRMIQVSSNVGKNPLSKAAELTRAALSDLKLPEGYYYRIGGNFPTMMATQKQFRSIIWLVFILIYLVLASLFESYYQPIIIMVSVPLALIGVVLALYFTGKSVGMGTLVGLMMLGGIVVSNAILLIDHVNNLKKRRINDYKCVLMASRDRLRPIFMTTIATILGLLPMAISSEEGSNLWSPLAITVIGGLTSSTILTLLIVPSVYIIFEDMKKRLTTGNFFPAKKKI